MRQAQVGLILTAVVAGVAGLIWGRGAAGAASLFGVLAVVIQMAAVAALRPAMDAPVRKLAVRWLMGMGMRLGGAALWAGAVVIDRTTFPPLATALGYLGVLVPLLFMEMRFLK